LTAIAIGSTRRIEKNSSQEGAVLEDCFERRNWKERMPRLDLTTLINTHASGTMAIAQGTTLI
jgi:hypothetical protein